MLFRSDSGEVLYDMQEPIDGDDLSENLYRICVGQKLRYGHSTKLNQVVSQTVVERMQNEYKTALESGGYKISIHSVVRKSAKLPDAWQGFLRLQNTTFVARSSFKIA